jgi:hypothetical protein
MSTIPEDVLTRFREANDQFHQARLRLNELDQMSLEDRRDLASALRAAEKEVEAVTAEISKLLAQQGHSGESPAAGSGGRPQ